MGSPDDRPDPVEVVSSALALKWPEVLAQSFSPRRGTPWADALAQAGVDALRSRGLLPELVEARVPCPRCERPDRREQLPDRYPGSICRTCGDELGAPPSEPVEGEAERGSER